MFPGRVGRAWPGNEVMSKVPFKREALKKYLWNKLSSPSKRESGEVTFLMSQSLSIKFLSSSLPDPTQLLVTCRLKSNKAGHM